MFSTSKLQLDSQLFRIIYANERSRTRGLRHLTIFKLVFFVVFDSIFLTHTLNRLFLAYSKFASFRKLYMLQTHCLTVHLKRAKN